MQMVVTLVPQFPSSNSLVDTDDTTVAIFACMYVPIHSRPLLYDGLGASSSSTSSVYKSYKRMDP